MMDCGKPTIAADGDQIVIRVPMSFKRRGGRKEIIVPEGLDDECPRPNRNRPLAVAVARAHRWRALLEEGRFRSVSALARKLGVDPSYASRIMRLTVLSPNIIKDILKGIEPGNLSIGQFARLPVEWDEQRQQLKL